MRNILVCIRYLLAVHASSKEQYQRRDTDEQQPSRQDPESPCRKRIVLARSIPIVVSLSKQLEHAEVRVVQDPSISHHFAQQKRDSRA